MTDPARPAGTESGEASPFPAAYGSLESSPELAADEDGSSPKGSGRPDKRAARPARAARRDEGPTLRRRRRPEPSQDVVPAVAGATGVGIAQAGGLARNDRTLASESMSRSAVAESAVAPRQDEAPPVVRPEESPAAPESTAPPGAPPEDQSGPTRVTVARARGRVPLSPPVPAPEVEAEPDVAPPARRPRRPPRILPDDVAREVVRQYAPDAELKIGRHHWWQLRRKVTVMRSRSSRRLVRRLDTWTVFKVSFVFYVLFLAAVLVAGLVAWHVAYQVGFIHDIQKAVRSLADDTKFQLHGRVIFKYTAVGGGILAVAGTILNVVAAMLYNLISDIFGGVQLVVVSEPD
jgi:hypothetical protein